MSKFHLYPCGHATSYRGTAPIRNTPSVGPYSSPRGVGVSYERGTPVPVWPCDKLPTRAQESILITDLTGVPRP